VVLADSARLVGEMGKRTRLGSFIHTTWTNLNVRCGNGKYHSKRTREKCLTYESILIQFTRDEFKFWCIRNKEIIERLSRPLIDRVDKNKNYTIDNIQVTDLSEHIRKDKTVFHDGFGVCFVCGETKEEEDFCKDNRRLNGRSSICKRCESLRGIRRYKERRYG